MNNQEQQQQQQGPQINSELVINQLLEENKRLTKEKAVQVAITLQMQQEAQAVIEEAQKIQGQNDELQKKLDEMEKKIAKLAGPAPVKTEVIDAEPAK